MSPAPSQPPAYPAGKASSSVRHLTPCVAAGGGADYPVLTYKEGEPLGLVKHFSAKAAQPAVVKVVIPAEALSSSNRQVGWRTAPHLTPPHCQGSWAQSLVYNGTALFHVHFTPQLWLAARSPGGSRPARQAFDY